MDIINRTNNIPVKFDLYITVTSPEIKNRLENNINSKQLVKIFGQYNCV